MVKEREEKRRKTRGHCSWEEVEVILKKM